MWRLRCSPLAKHFPQSITPQTKERRPLWAPYGLIEFGAVGTLLPRLFFVRLGTGTGPTCPRRRFAGGGTTMDRGLLVSWGGCDGMLAGARVGIDVDSGADEGTMWSTVGGTVDSGCSGEAAVLMPFSSSSSSTSLSPLLWTSASCCTCGVISPASRSC